MGTVAGLLLAAGGGRRYGMPKALASPLGEPMVVTGLGTLRGAALRPVVVVVGAAGLEVGELVREAVPDVAVMDNADWETGMGSSLRVGLTALLADPEVDAAIVLLVDTPGITSAAVARVAAGGTRGLLRAASYGGKQGHPVLLGRDHWDGVMETAIGDVGARPYLQAHQVELVACDDVADGTDLDRPPAA